MFWTNRATLSSIRQFAGSKALDANPFDPVAPFAARMVGHPDDEDPLALMRETHVRRADDAARNRVTQLL
jgi:hypothetical protein